MPVLFLDVVDGLEVPVQIGSYIIPRISRVMNIFVCPFVRQEHLSCVRFDIGKCIEYVAGYMNLVKPTQTLPEAQYAREILNWDR